MKYSVDNIVKLLARIFNYEINDDEIKALFSSHSIKQEWINNESHKCDFESNRIQREIDKRNNPPEGHHIVRINPKPLLIDKTRNSLKEVHILESVKVLSEQYVKYPKLIQSIYDLYKSGKLKTGFVYDYGLVFESIYEGTYCNCEPYDDDLYKYLVIRVFDNNYDIILSGD